MGDPKIQGHIAVKLRLDPMSGAMGSAGGGVSVDVSVGDKGDKDASTDHLSWRHVPGGAGQPAWSCEVDILVGEVHTRSVRPWRASLAVAALQHTSENRGFVLYAIMFAQRIPVLAARSDGIKRV